MFRSQPNEFDELVAKATDENLTVENWDLIMETCDKVQADPSTNSKEVVAAIIKRLAHRNANVQLYTLELANALVQNCGEPVHRELASRSFTEKLLNMAADRATHAQVKTKIQSRMEDWVREFESNPDFGIMDQALQTLRSKNPSIQPPSRPQKTEISSADRRREEEELAMALALSMQESQKQKQSVVEPGPLPQSQSTSRPGQPVHQAQTQHEDYPPSISEQQQHQQSDPRPALGSTAATVSRVRALYDFNPTEQGELQFCKGDIITVLESVYHDWWRGSLRGQTGIFPLNYVEKLADPTREELERDARMEAEVFEEMRNVEKLLALLSTNPGSAGPQENDEISQLYHSTLAIRPKLIELIGKYSRKKEEFTQLNEKFIKARREYETLLEASMTHPTGGYGRPSYNGYGSQFGPTGQPAQAGPSNGPYAPAQTSGGPGAFPTLQSAFHILGPEQQQQHRLSPPAQGQQHQQPSAGLAPAESPVPFGAAGLDATGKPAGQYNPSASTGVPELAGGLLGPGPGPAPTAYSPGPSQTAAVMAYRPQGGAAAGSSGGPTTPGPAPAAVSQGRSPGQYTAYRPVSVGPGGFGSAPEGELGEAGGAGMGRSQIGEVESFYR